MCNGYLAEVFVFRYRGFCAGVVAMLIDPLFVTFMIFYVVIFGKELSEVDFIIILVTLVES